ncbi:MAG: class I SAM-dependent methyltransferase [Candidatus Saccharimonadales bacterium]
MQEEYSRRNVRRETFEHYKGRWPVSADARRNLYLKYAKYPDDVALERGESLRGGEIRDMWKEVALTLLDNLGDTRDKRGIDVGASSGYFIRQLMESGYRGEVIGVDIETGHQPFLQWELSQEFPGSTIVLGGSDAQSLREVRLTDDDGSVVEALRIDKNSFDFLTELFVLYHVPDPRRAYVAAHKVLKPSGIAIFSGRGRLNQRHLWNLGVKIADNFDARVPQSFYDHHSLDDIESYLKESPYFEVIESATQADHLWIPATDEGWADYRAALMSLRPLMKDRSGKPINGKVLGDYLDSKIRKDEFEVQAAANHGYFIDYVFQNYYVCRNIK